MLKNEKEQFDHCVRMIQELSWGKDWRSDLRMVSPLFESDQPSYGSPAFSY
jgi:hypothetical protein